MYHAVVRSLLKGVFKDLSAGKADKLLAMFIDAPEHIVAGRSPLGGARHTVGSVRKWYARLFELFPDISFEVRSIAVRGWPWNTIAAVEWMDRPAIVDGVQWINEGVNIIRLRWGRTVSVHVYCDTEKLATLCDLLSSRG